MRIKNGDFARQRKGRSGVGCGIGTCHRVSSSSFETARGVQSSLKACKLHVQFLLFLTVPFNWY